MKIAIISLHFTEYSFELAAALSKDNKVLLILHSGEYERVLSKRKLVYPNLLIKCIPAKSMYSIGSWINIYLLRAWIKDFSPDIIHAQETVTIYVAIAIRLLGRYRKVLTVHDPEDHIGERYSMQHTLSRKLLRKSCDCYIVHAEKMREALRRTIDKNKEIYVIPHGCFTIYGSAETEKVPVENIILFFGRVYEYKGLKYILDAMKYVIAEVPDAKLVIAGAGPGIDAYRETIHKNKSCELLEGYVHNSDVAGMFQRASVIALPYIEATQSGVAAIAYSFGKPVVATRVGGLHEMIDDSKTGILVPPQNAEKLAEAIVYLFKNPAKRVEMGENALKKAKGELSWATVAEKTNKVYSQIL